MMEGSGSVLVSNGSGSGSRKPKTYGSGFATLLGISFPTRNSGSIISGANFTTKGINVSNTVLYHLMIPVTKS